jgi:SAM-dependent methyltransferase
MTALSDLNPTGRFTGRASAYARYRPDYPAAAVDTILARCGLGSGSLLVDVGCGTGIASRLLAARGLEVIGVEPNAEMRSAAEAASGVPGSPIVTYRDGQAEATGLPSGIAAAVLAAQAFHWFEPEAALREFRRLLQPDGWAVLMWNERDESDEFTAAYGAVLRTSREAAAVESPHHGRSGNALLASPLFESGERVTLSHQQAFDEDSLVGRAFSVSYSPADEAEARAWADRLRGLHRRFQRAGFVVLRYRTSIYTARSWPT